MSSEDWPDHREIRQRRHEFIDAELGRMRRQLIDSADVHDADLMRRRREALAQANEYFDSRDPRSLAERLGYPSSDRREDNF